MKLLPFASLLALVFAGCASDPLLSGKPQDWQGKPAADLRAAWGEPTKVITQSDGEYWEYTNGKDYVIPASEDTNFRLGGGSSGYNSGTGASSSGFGASGGISKSKSGERVSHVENVARFLIRDGKVKKWSAARIVDGQTVWSDH
jgi:hypothetical protein